MANRKYRKLIFVTLILFISIGFAILSSNLSLTNIFTITEASFDVHFSDVTIDESTIENATYLYSNSNKEINFTIPFDKPGDYIDYKLYAVNGGTIDAALETISITIPDTIEDYVTYTLTYYNGQALTAGDLLRVGTNIPFKLHIEYNYNIDDFIDVNSVSITLTLKYKQPQTVNTKVWNFDYQGAEQVFVVPKTGTYKLEVWGAQGGDAIGDEAETYIGGYGGYSTGAVNLNKNDKIYINIGGKGTTNTGVDEALELIESDNSIGYNGGSLGQLYTRNSVYGGGGGATHIALVSGLLSELEQYKGTLVNDSYYVSNKILIVAGGGGGAVSHELRSVYTYEGNGGSGGGFKGSLVTLSSCYCYASGGTQIAPTILGYSCNPSRTPEKWCMVCCWKFRKW